MGKMLRTASACALVLGLAGVTQEAAAGIANTRHNLSNTFNTTLLGTGNHVTDTADICVFCHTPHNADVTQTDNPPLWNKRLNTGQAYQTYAQMNSASIDGQILAVGSISLACLSCHDGAQAMDNMINAPGSGGLDSTGGGAGGRNLVWTGSPRIDAGGLGQMTGIAAVGSGGDLRNDHPIGIEYCGGFTAGTTCRDGDFRAVNSRNVAAGNGIVTQYWVDTPNVGNATTRDRTDMWLYNRTFAAGAGRPSVECGTCHDPHVEAGQNGAGPTFLRVANVASAVCLACHTK
jgi:hypothetical protein